MANLVKVPKTGFNINPNVGILKYLRELLSTGLYGNNYGQAVEELVRQRIAQLIEADKLKLEKQKIDVTTDAEDAE